MSPLENQQVLPERLTCQDSVDHGQQTPNRPADEEPDHGHFYKGLIGWWFPRSFMISGACDLSIDSMKSMIFVISTPSIKNYHGKGPPSSMRGG